MKFSHTCLLLLFLGCLPITIFSQKLDYKYKSLPCLNKKVTIYAHVVKNVSGSTNIDESTILETVDSLNVYFEPICLSFEVCAFDSIDNWQYNVVDGQTEWDEILVKYHKANRLNLFFVKDAGFPHTNDCGFADLGSIQELGTDGIFIKKVCVGPNSKALAHLVGHYFGLLDTHVGNGIELVDGSNCETTGDLICDTPSDPYVKGENLNTYLDSLTQCRFFSQKVDANGDFYMPDVGNIMSSYPTYCKCGFTREQFLKMVETYEDSISKMW